MPETIRARNERLRSGPRRGGFLAAIAALSLAPTASAHATLDPQAFADAAASVFASMSRQEVATLTLTLGLLCFAVLSAIVLVRTRTYATRSETAARDEMTALRAEAERMKTLLMSEPQVLVSWTVAGEPPEIIGDINAIMPGGSGDRLIAFDAWLEPSVAESMQQSVDMLRAQGRAFSMMLLSLSGQPIEAIGRAIGGRAVLRLREVSGTKADLAEISTRYQNVLATAATLRDLVDA